jgi:condensin complex subunit 2
VSVQPGLCRRCVLRTFFPVFSHRRADRAAAPKQKREKKEAFKIDFYEPLGMSVKEFAKEKFAPPTRGVGINLPGYSLPSSSKPGKKGSKKKRRKRRRRKRGKNRCLPDDMHFSSRQLVTLFLKPDFSVCACRLLWLLIFD